MIKITQYIRVNVLTAVLFVVCALTSSIKILCVTYGVMLIHEIAHTVAALSIGLKISYIAFYPFGVNLRLKNKMIYSLADEIILYFSGPLCNALLAAAAIMIYKHFPIYDLYRFYVGNIALFLMNMLPATPLDGGIILKKILAYIMGSSKAEIILKIITAMTAACMMGLGIYVFIVTGFNFSMIIFSILMLGNMFTQKEKYDADFVKKLMFKNKKSKRKIKHIIISDKEKYDDVIKKLDAKHYNIIYQIDNCGKIKKIATETEFLNDIVR